MAYHFSASLPRVARPSVLPCPARTPSGTHFAARSAQAGFPEFLREMACERSLATSSGRLRVGLAATPWQLQQSLSLLHRHGSANPLSTPGQCGMPEATLERVVALAMNASLHSPDSGALATLWLRRDGGGGLPQDAWPAKHAALAEMRATGARLVAIEALAFDMRAPLQTTLESMMRALQTMVLDIWEATDIVADCPAAQLDFYCGVLGFRPVAGAQHAGAETVLLRQPIRRVKRLLQHDRHAARVA